MLQKLKNLICILAVCAPMTNLFADKAVVNPLKGEALGACYLMNKGKNTTCSEYSHLSPALYDAAKTSCESSNRTPSNNGEVVAKWVPNESCTRKAVWGICKISSPEYVAIWYEESVKNQKPEFKDSIKKMCTQSHARWSTH